MDIIKSSVWIEVWKKENRMMIFKLIVYSLLTLYLNITLFFNLWYIYEGMNIYYIVIVITSIIVVAFASIMLCYPFITYYFLDSSIIKTNTKEIKVISIKFDDTYVTLTSIMGYPSYRHKVTVKYNRMDICTNINKIDEENIITLTYKDFDYLISNQYFSFKEVSDIKQGLL